MLRTCRRRHSWEEAASNPLHHRIYLFEFVCVYLCVCDRREKGVSGRKRAYYRRNEKNSEEQRKEGRRERGREGGRDRYSPSAAAGAAVASSLAAITVFG